jgi:hypothetical protein
VLQTSDCGPDVEHRATTYASQPPRVGVLQTSDCGPDVEHRATTAAAEEEDMANPRQEVEEYSSMTSEDTIKVMPLESKLAESEANALRNCMCV